MSKSEQFIQYSYYEKTVIDSFELILNKLMFTLDLTKYINLYNECIQIFLQIWKRMRKGTKFRSPKRLGPVIIYMILKAKGFDIKISYFIEKININKKKFTEILKQAVIFYPTYFKRDRKTVIIKKINETREIFGFDRDFTNKYQEIFKKFWPIIKNTKDDVIAGVIFILTMIALGINSIPFVHVCNKIGIKMSTVNYQVKNKIFKSLHLPGFKSLKKSSNVIKDLIDKIIKK